MNSRTKFVVQCQDGYTWCWNQEDGYRLDSNYERVPEEAVMFPDRMAAYRAIVNRQFGFGLWVHECGEPLVVKYKAIISPGFKVSKNKLTKALKKIVEKHYDDIGHVKAEKLLALCGVYRQVRGIYGST